MNPETLCYVAMVDLGTLPDWLVAVGTLGAFATGGWVLIRELGRDHAQRTHEERAQAEKIAAWGEQVKLPDPTPGSAGTIKRVRLSVMNGSELPVYGACIIVQTTGQRRLTNVDMGLLPAGATNTQVIEPTDEYAFYSAQPVEVYFTDNAGIRWIRDIEGTLLHAPPTTIIENVYLPRSRWRRYRPRTPDDELAVVPRLIRCWWDKRRAVRKLKKQGQ